MRKMPVVMGIGWHCLILLKSILAYVKKVSLCERGYHISSVCVRFPDDRNILATSQLRLTDSVTDFLWCFNQSLFKKTETNLLCAHTLSHNAWPYRGFFHVGERGKMQWIIDNLLHFLCFVLFVGTAPYPSPRCVQSCSVAKQWPRNCETPGSKPCRCAILVPFCGTLILITVIYDLRA